MRCLRARLQSVSPGVTIISLIGGFCLSVAALDGRCAGKALTAGVAAVEGAANDQGSETPVGAGSPSGCIPIGSGFPARFLNCLIGLGNGELLRNTRSRSARAANNSS